MLGHFNDERWARGIDEINEFEAQQRDYGTMIVKLFFHVTPEGRRPTDARARRPVAASPARRSADHRAGNRDRANDVLQDLLLTPTPAGRRGSDRRQRSRQRASRR
jgi:hypothetical protein